MVQQLNPCQNEKMNMVTGGLKYSIQGLCEDHSIPQKNGQINLHPQNLT